MESHIVEIELSNLGEGLHAIALDLFTSERLRFVNPICPVEEPVATSCENGKIRISIKTRENWCRILVGLNETKDSLDPLDVFSAHPGANNMYMMDKSGVVSLPFWLTNSQFTSGIAFHFQPRGNTMIDELNVQTDLTIDVDDNSYSGDASFYLSNISAGAKKITADICFNTASGLFDTEVRASRHQTHIPIACYLNETLLGSSKYGIAIYAFDEFNFATIDSPLYYYADDSMYCVNFTAPKRFVLRIDANDREEIEYLLLDPMPQDFSIVQTTYFDEPCYQFTFQASADFNVCLGLRLRSKGWFLYPEDMSLAAIPTEIEREYLTSTSSLDGHFFDLEDCFVQEWAKQVVHNETNPFLIAELIFENVTTTLKYPIDWRTLDDKGAFNESVSKILVDGKGVCRHFARTYASLCICSGLPARTVFGTAFSFLNETHKKNHEWTEVYLPGVGWVTVDSSWNQSYVLCNKHAKSTWWTYFDDSLNVSKNDAPALVAARSLESQNLMKQLIDLFRTRTPSSLGNLSSAELLLDKAAGSIELGLIHDGLVLMAEASLLVPTTQTISYLSINVFLVATVLLGATILAIAWIIGQREIDPSFLADAKSLHSFSDEDKIRRKLEYDALNRLVNSREQSTLTIGTILSSACFLMLTVAFRTDSLEAKFLITSASILLAGIWLWYYRATEKLDYVCYDLLKKIESARRISVHKYLHEIREKAWLVKARKYIWPAIFLVVWTLGVIALL